MSVSKNFTCLLLLVVGGLVLPMAKAAGEMLDILVIQIGTEWQNSTINQIPGITITVVNASELMGIDFSDFDALYVSDVYDAASTPDWAGVLNDRSKDILAFIDGGGFVLVGGQNYAGDSTTNGDEYNFLGGLVDAPADQLIFGNDVVITEPDHPLFDGLTSSDLSNWATSYHGILGGTLPVLATNSGGDPLIRGGPVGAGGVFVWSLDPDLHFDLFGILACLELVENAVGLPPGCEDDMDCADGDQCTDYYCDDGECVYIDNDLCCNTYQCAGDVNGDGLVDSLDSGAIRGRFGLSPCNEELCQYDVNCDGAIDPLDSGFVRARFSTCQEPEVCKICE